MIEHFQNTIKKFFLIISQWEQSKKFNLLIVLLILAAVPLTIFVSQKQQETRQRASEITSPLTEEEKKVAGIDVDGKIIAERAQDIAKTNPKLYEQLVKDGRITNPQTVHPHGGSGAGGGPTPPPLTPPTISTCGEITQSGNYTLTQDVSVPTDTCIAMHDARDVTLDCQNHTITSNSNGIAVYISNVQNFTVKNCTIQTTGSLGGMSLYLQNSAGGNIQNNTFMKGYVNANNSNHLQISSNSFRAHYQQDNSSYNQITNNTFKNNPADPADSSIVIALNVGTNNTIQNNTLDGSWDGVDHAGGWREYTGADDGIDLYQEKQDVISGNTISNTWDCGIETSFIQDTQITNNKINNSGICGIGGWYWNSWLHNTVDGNIVDGAAHMFYMFRTFGFNQDQNEQIIYFKDNTFTNNTFVHQRNNSYLGPSGPFSSWIDFQNMPPEIPPSAIQIGNNIFKNNDFGQIPAPVIMPAGMIVDQGGNKCLPTTDTYIRPLACGNAVAPSPTVSPTPIVASPVSFTLTPKTANIQSGQELSIKVILQNTPDLYYTISGVDTTIKFDNTLLTAKSFTPSPLFTSKLINTIDAYMGSIHYAAVESQQKIKQPTYELGTITFVGKAAGEAKVTVGETQITAIGSNTAIPTKNNDQGNYTITQITPTIAPTASCSILYEKIQNSFGSTCRNGDARYNSIADLNKDRQIDVQDFSLFLRAKTSGGANGETCANFLTATANPCAAPRNKISWKTNDVSLEADNFFLIANGKQYFANSGNTAVHSNSADSASATLETTWQENGTEMRLNIYFSADVNNWTISKIRTYNGNQPSTADWIYYNGITGKSLNTPLITDSLELISIKNNTNDTSPLGIIHFDNIKVLPIFSNTTPTAAATPQPLRGDANGDGVVDILDYNIWRDEFLGILTTKKSDFNHDGIIDLLDFNIWRNAINPQ